jgi:hypothetical protein
MLENPSYKLSLNDLNDMVFDYLNKFDFRKCPIMETMSDHT